MSSSTEAVIIDGKAIAETIRAELRQTITQLSLEPQLAIVQVGERADSGVYIRMKQTFADSIGVRVRHIRLSASATTQNELEQLIDSLNHDSTIHGIIAQLPFDCVNQLDEHAAINRISPRKDVDGLTAINAGHIAQRRSDLVLEPCTPAACIRLIRSTGVSISGSTACVLGRSTIVGSPVSQLLLANDATVTICHRATRNLIDHCRAADILICAIGQPRFVRRDWIKPGAVVIDVGISSIPDSTRKSGQRLVGDVDFEEAKTVAGHITPVPGGVGPMTVAMLMHNTVESARRFATSPRSTATL